MLQKQTVDFNMVMLGCLKFWKGFFATISGFITGICTEVECWFSMVMLRISEFGRIFDTVLGYFLKIGTGLRAVAG